MLEEWQRAKVRSKLSKRAAMPGMYFEWTRIGMSQGHSLRDGWKRPLFRPPPNPAPPLLLPGQGGGVINSSRRFARTRWLAPPVRDKSLTRDPSQSKAYSTRFRFVIDCDRNNTKHSQIHALLITTQPACGSFHLCIALHRVTNNWSHGRQVRCHSAISKVADRRRDHWQQCGHDSSGRKTNLSQSRAIGKRRGPGYRFQNPVPHLVDDETDHHRRDDDPARTGQVRLG